MPLNTPPDCSLCIDTPWGRSQTVTHWGPGLDFFSTASHGGFRLSLDRWEELNAAFQFRSWAGPFWLEEDEDSNLAVIRWPELFPAEWVFSAVRYVQANPGENHWAGWTDNLRGARAWLGTEAGSAARKIALEFAATVAGLWEVGFMGTSPHGWTVCLRRDAHVITCLFPEYPQKRFYTDAEVAPMIRTPQTKTV